MIQAARDVLLEFTLRNTNELAFAVLNPFHVSIWIRYLNAEIPATQGEGFEMCGSVGRRQGRHDGPGIQGPARIKVQLRTHPRHVGHIGHVIVVRGWRPIFDDLILEGSDAAERIRDLRHLPIEL